MAKDLYDKLCGYYEFMLGPLPWREEFERALQETVGEEELRILFRIPFSGAIPHAKLAKKAQLPAEQLQAILNRLAAEGMIMSYSRGGQTVYERGNPVFMTEQQVRKEEDTPRRRFYARLFYSILNGEVAIVAPTKTPYYRVLPVEATLTGERAEAGRRVIPVEVDVPDPRAVLPIDIVSEMIRRDARIIGVADCYCRRTKRLVGEGCDHPLQTCLVFNKVAETLIEHGTARRIDVEEALEIVRMAEAHGLVHNVDNCEGEIGSVCNCCACCSILLTSWQRGATNADSPSRYRVAFDVARCELCQACVKVCPTGARAVLEGRMEIDDGRCLGCGLCVTACLQGANRMVPREVHVSLPATAEALYGKIGREAIVGIAKQRVVGLLRRQ
jgi:Pyruvate/2-oxoacid:ferredoxin oxidoreductase delta subunit